MSEQEIVTENAVVRRLKALDPEHFGLQRGVRTAIAATVMMVVGTLLNNPQIALLGVFGAVATLLFVELPGNRQARWAGYVMLGIVGLILICLGTLASTNLVLSVAGMGVFGFVILFAGVLSAGAAASGKAAILLFLLPVMVSGSPADILPRLVGWILGWAVSVSLSMFLWPRRDFDRLRAAVTQACRATARAISAPTALDDPDRLEQVEQAALAAMTDLRRAFRASTSRPVGLSAGGRLLGRTINDLESLFSDTRDLGGPAVMAKQTAAVAEASADVLNAAADALDTRSEIDLTRLEASITALSTVREQALSAWVGSVLDGGPAQAFAEGSSATERMHGLAYSSDQIGRHVAASIDADARPALDKLLGRGTTVVAASPISAIERLTRYHLSWRSVWFHNSLRGALGLALAVLVAQLLDVQHGFWVGLGTLSVLRSTASNTGSTAVRAVIGTAIGVIVAAPIVVLLGAGPGLWVALPVTMFLAGFATAALPLAVGQGAFSAAVLVLFALLEPGGPPVGLVRVEDVLIGSISGVVVGLLLWPRGAAAEIRRAMSGAYRAGADLLDQAVARVVASSVAEPVDLAEVRGATLRLDDALRQYLADRGGKPDEIDDLMLVCVGAERLRMSGEAIAALEGGEDHPEALPTELVALLRRRADKLTQWDNRLADALVVSGKQAESGQQVAALPDPPAADLEAEVVLWADQHPQQARAALTADGGPPSTAASQPGTITPGTVVWTTIHLDHVARLQLRGQSQLRAILPTEAQVTARRGLVSPVAG